MEGGVGSYAAIPGLEFAKIHRATFQESAIAGIAG
jgi:hypothetical protein